MFPITKHTRALLELENSHDDGRKDFSERKFCKYETAWLTCPNKLLGVCKTQAEIERMQYWELISDEFEFENWQADKCPVVKYDTLTLTLIKLICQRGGYWMECIEGNLKRFIGN